jgi:hypothetical protein
VLINGAKIMAIRFSEASIGKEENGHETNESSLYIYIYLSRFNDSVGYLHAGGGALKKIIKFLEETAVVIAWIILLPFILILSLFFSPTKRWKKRDTKK